MNSNLIKKFLNKERQGTSTFEWVMTCPFSIGLVFICFFIMLILLSWASYGSVASEIAKSMNVKNAGIEKAEIWYTKKIAGNGVVITPSSPYALGGDITMEQISINDGVGDANIINKYKKVAAYHMQDTVGRQNQFYFPYTKFDNIKIYMKQLDSSGKYTSNLSSTNNMSNYIIKVDIYYQFAGLGLYSREANLCATGYGVVS